MLEGTRGEVDVADLLAGNPPESSRLKSLSILRCAVSAKSPPSESRKLMVTMVGSSSAMRIVTAPETAGRRVTNRVTGMGATSRSWIDTPVELSPAWTARFSMRALRLESRDVITVSPARIVEPYAMATRVASSGVMSTLEMPRTPVLPNKLRAPRVSQTIDAFDRGPRLDRLEWIHLHISCEMGALTTKHSSPMTTPGSALTPARRSQDLPTTVPVSDTPSAT